MSNVFITDMAYSLGAERYALEESAAAGRLQSSASDLAAAGFRWHYLCGPKENAYDLAKDAVRELPMDTGVDAIVYSTCLPQNGNVGDFEAWEATKDVKHLMDFPASRLQADFNLNFPAVFGLSQQGCTGMLGSLRLAGALLAAEPGWQRVLCLSADRFPDGALYEQSYNLISDGAAACFVTSQAQPGGLRLVTAHQITNGGLHDASNDETVGTFFSYVPRLVRETLERAGLTTDDIAWVVPQNTNHHAWKIAARMLRIDQDRVWQSALPDIGHAISADNVINLKALLGTGRVTPGQYILLVMAGHGLNWQAVILKAEEGL
ncbi:3-oxoacyl-[acyl-carrier-protein] synthase III C-terminal domain-containing protein [Streptomyces sp. NPDC056704]|uniref:3-oxoacyl-[acyl-carrier-protein] synthase III C-terminal domain-containing protein n=1 Tax=Streptomyces sp. NPDC056704 TaxID=3345917 RepID=UPI0036A1DB3A